MQNTEIPRFGSFKPKATLLHRPVTNQGSSNKRGYKDYSASTLAERPSYSSRQDKSVDHDRKHRRYHISECDVEGSGLFVIDRFGDAQNVQYGSLHRYSVPNYSRSGLGSLIGISSNVKYNETVGHSEIALCHVRDVGRAGTRQLLRNRGLRNEAKARKLIVPSKSVYAEEHSEDFIEFEPPSKKRRGSIIANETLSKRALKYSHLNLGATDRSDSESSRSSADEDGVIDDSQEASIRQDIHTTLSGAIKDNPKSVTAWLAYINHQAEVVHPDLQLTNLSTCQRRNLADIRLSIYDQAFRHTSADSEDCDLLLLSWLHEGRLVWDQPKFAAKWQTVLEEHPGSVALQLEYLNVIQTDHRGFHYEQCRRAYIECLDTIYVLLTSGTQLSRTTQLSRAYMHVLGCFMNFVRDSGYKELSYAVWQVLLEYYYFRPGGLRDRAALLTSLEDFWESDVARIGENGSLGWKSSVGGAKSTLRQSIITNNRGDVADHSVITAARNEALLVRAFSFPIASAAAEEHVDPFAHVMFSDLRPILDRLPDDLPWEMVVNGFLSHMGLPELSASDLDEADWDISSLRAYTTEVGNMPPPMYPLSSTFVRLSSTDQPATPFLLLTSAFDPESTTTSPSRMSAVPEWIVFVDRILQSLLLERVGDDRLAEYMIAFKLQYLPADTLKAAKRALKTRTESLRLYNAYALAAARSGNMSKAKEVWSTALKMSEDLDQEAQEDAILLLHSRMLMLVKSGDEGEALRCLLLMTKSPTIDLINEEQIHVGQRLKATRNYEDGMHEMQVKTKFIHVALYAECLVWLNYLLEDHALPVAMAVFQVAARRLEGSRALRAFEILHRAKAALIEHHIERHRPYQARMLRNELESSLKKFPDNRSILRAFSSFTSRSRVDMHLHDPISDSLSWSPSSGLGLSSFVIDRKIKRFGMTEVSGSTASSVRSTFNQMLTSFQSKVRHAPELWLRWLNFELQLSSDSSGAGERSTRHNLQKAHTVFLHGLQALPWHKFWLVNGLAELSEQRSIPKEEMEQIWNVMHERGLRVTAAVAAAL